MFYSWMDSRQDQAVVQAVHDIVDSLIVGLSTLLVHWGADEKIYTGI